MRRDARRNRDQLLRTARELLLHRGAQVSMDDIAKEAGVGIGTLYRHFPDRYSLLKGIATANMTTVAEECAAILAAETDGRRCLIRFLGRVYEQRLGDPVPLLLPQLIEQARSDPDFQAARRAAAGGVGRILERAKADGAVRDDVQIADLLTLATARPDPAPIFGDELAAGLRERQLRIVVDGLSPSASEPLPTPALADEELDAFFGDASS